MSSMFENYDVLTPNDYIPNNLHYDNTTPVEPTYPLVAYNSQGIAVGYTWNYGDVVYLEFTTTGNVVYSNLGFTEDAETYLKGKKFKLVVYNSRCESVAQCECDAKPVVKILSDSMYPSTLVKGVYHLKLTLMDEDNNTLTTLLGWDDCIIYIK